MPLLTYFPSSSKASRTGPQPYIHTRLSQSSLFRYNACALPLVILFAPTRPAGCYHCRIVCVSNHHPLQCGRAHTQMARMVYASQRLGLNRIA